MPLRMFGGRTARRSTALLTTAAVLAALLTGALAAPAAAARPTCGGKVATIVGTNRGEIIVGTAGDDVIVAKGGDDVVYGRGGNDIICGGGGADRLYGEGGNDRLFGGAGRDKLYGGAGDDRLHGGSGTDTCYQGPGTGPRISCERPAPKVRQLVVGGPGSGQAGAYFYATVVSGGTGPWSVSDDLSCRTGRALGPPRGTEYEYRFALEFPLSDLPAGATIVRAQLSISAQIAAPTQRLYGYAGDGSITVSDATPGGPLGLVRRPFIGFDAPAPGYQTVDVTSLVSASMVTAGWAGFMQARFDSPGATWACRATDPGYPRLTIEYMQP
jgi:hypothetical protein